MDALSPYIPTLNIQHLICLYCCPLPRELLEDILYVIKIRDRMCQLIPYDFRNFDLQDIIDQANEKRLSIYRKKDLKYGVKYNDRGVYGEDEGIMDDEDALMLEVS